MWMIILIVSILIGSFIWAYKQGTGMYNDLHELSELLTEDNVHILDKYI